MKHKNNGLVPDGVFMSQRMQIAALAMQGLMMEMSAKYSPEKLARTAFNVADAMIKEEKKSEELKSRIGPDIVGEE